MASTTTLAKASTVHPLNLIANRIRVAAAIAVLAVSVCSLFVAVPLFHFMAGLSALYFWASSSLFRGQLAGKWYSVAALAATLIAVILGFASYA